jgi:hypothetical protein
LPQFSHYIGSGQSSPQSCQTGDITYDIIKFNDITIMWYHIMVISGKITWHHIWCHVWYGFTLSLGHVISWKCAWFHIWYHEKITISHDPKTGKTHIIHDIIYDIMCDITQEIVISYKPFISYMI